MRARVANWFRTWWLRVPRPRELSIAFTVAYSVALLTGIATLLRVPLLYEQSGVFADLAPVGALLSFGAATAMVGGALEHWKVERVGLWLMSGALVIYSGVVFARAAPHPGPRFTLLGVICLALCLFFVRYLMIRRFTFRPRG